ncbi:iron-siderophore ABC transporter substrate-binding protein [Pantanalinema rosaneae CENA516]|uniref:iron-siderophore ABC transporter substrate-binding protein n=1 Tax=Pantanalinema rosaneae TaxID=1620701 RepID=UPI003D6F79AA
MTMIRKSWWQRLQLFLVGTLVVGLIQSGYGIANHRSQAVTPEIAPSACRTVQHELGESCIPHHPQRIVVMDQESLELLAALGSKPIAAATSNRVANKTAILQDKIGAIADLGKEGQPNLERIVQLKPDLILGMFIGAHNYALLSQIAPTVSLEYSQTGWKKTLQQMADIVDQRQKAEKLLTAYQQRVEALRSLLAARMGDRQICVMRFYTDVHLTQFLNQNSFAVSVLEEVAGLAIPPIQRQQQQVPNSDWGYVNISLERIDWLEADAMFIALDPGAESSFQHYASNPLWQTLKVVQQDRVYMVDSGYWIFGNILSANAILDDLSKYLSQKQDHSQTNSFT